jgi:histidine kinase
LIYAHGGEIWAESDGLGRGTRITFTLPTVVTS